MAQDTSGSDHTISTRSQHGSRLFAAKSDRHLLIQERNMLAGEDCDRLTITSHSGMYPYSQGRSGTDIDRTEGRTRAEHSRYSNA